MSAILDMDIVPPHIIFLLGTTKTILSFSDMPENIRDACWIIALLMATTTCLHLLKVLRNAICVYINKIRMCECKLATQQFSSQGNLPLHILSLQIEIPKIGKA